MKLQTSEREVLEDLVLKKTGLKIDPGRYAEVSRALAAMIDSEGSGLYPLLSALERHPTTHPLWNRLVNLVTVGETYFFRDANQFQALWELVLPELIARRRAAGFKYLSLWSAGCATGEEPYSLAIMLRELIPDLADWTLRILGTDISLTSLEIARRGLYRGHSFRAETRPGVQERWFAPRQGSFELDLVIRKMVEFRPLNLVSDEYPSFETGTMNLDLIICRNVTIYFQEAVTRRVVERFHHALGEDGWLVVGHAEPLASVYGGFTPRNFENAVLYQKQPYSAPIQPLEPIQPCLSELPTRSVAPAPAPTPPPTMNALQEARAAAGREDWGALPRLLTMAERENPMEPHVHYLRALMLLHTGQQEGALESLRRAIYCDSSFALAYYTLGELHEKRGDHQEARRCWQASQRAVADRQPDDHLSPDDDLTVEMFQGLLGYRLSALSNGG